MSLTVTPLTPEDLRELISMAPEHEAGFEAMGVNLRGLECLGLARAARDGRLLGCGGLIQPWEGVATAWLALTRHGRRYPVRSWSRMIRRFLVQEAQALRLWRIEATVRSGALSHLKFAGHFGFQVEGVKRQYYADRADGYMMAWLREQHTMGWGGHDVEGSLSDRNWQRAHRSNGYARRSSRAAY